MLALPGTIATASLIVPCNRHILKNIVDAAVLANLRFLSEMLVVRTTANIKSKYTGLQESNACPW